MQPLAKRQAPTGHRRLCFTTFVDGTHRWRQEADASQQDLFVQMKIDQRRIELSWKLLDTYYWNALGAVYWRRYIRREVYSAFDSW
jgi:hypothetical protein